MNPLEIKLHGHRLKNPLLTASGTFAYGIEAAKLQDTKAWGGLVSSAITLEPRAGNPLPRVAETASGMLNSVGLENPGLEVFRKEILTRMRELTDFLVINLAGRTHDDYIALVEGLAEATEKGLVDALELNLSCPNVRSGCMSIGTDAHEIGKIVREIRPRTELPLWVKLTPNVTNIAEMAMAAEEAGADAVSLVNTFLGMKIDVKTRRPVLANRTGGLSGPAIKPIAVRMVYDVSQAVSIPVIGMGGIETAEDVLEFLLAGASAVQLGTYNLRHPFGVEPILADLEQWLRQEDATIEDYIGAMEAFA